MARHNESGDGARIAPLSDVDDFEVAEGYPDVRGWRVNAADGTEVGKVHELLVDLDSLRTRYLDVRLTADVAATTEDRDVLVPIGAARIDDDHDLVTVPLNTERVGLLPPYTHGGITREQEYEVRRHFSFSRAAAEGAAAAGAATAGAAASAEVAPDTRDFYDDEAYDDQRFFTSRRRPTDVADSVRAAADSEVRVPLQPDDSVVVKRGEGGRDEIIIRRPRGDERTAG